MTGVTIDIVTCPQWGALPPRNEPVLCNKSVRYIMHHTAGHHAEIENPADESLEEAKAYARSIQRFHMDSNGWADSGHNFLVTRGGHILQGRWMTVTAIQHRKMVVSAHCPGQNDQIGIEFEHLGTEEMTAAQRNAGARLMAWIAWKYRRSVMPMDPHRKYFATACPANLADDITDLRRLATNILDVANGV
jgi:hypothetical protein